MERQTAQARADELRLLDRRMQAVAVAAGKAAGAGPYVPSEGGVGAKAAIVGFCPMPADDRPFTDPAVALEREVLLACGVPNELVLLTHVLRERPLEHRVSESLREWLPLLIEQLRLVRPKAILLLGVHASEAVLGQHELDIERLRHVRFVLTRSLPASNIFVTYSPDQVWAEGGLNSNLGCQFTFDHMAVFKGQYYGNERSYFRTTKLLES